MAELKRAIEELTSDQFRVMNQLHQHGKIMVYPFLVGEELSTTARALNEIYGAREEVEIVALSGGPWPLEKSAFNDLVVPLRLTESWQDAIRRYILQCAAVHPLRGETVAKQSEAWVSDQLTRLSDRPHPGKADIDLVCRTVRQIHLPLKLRRFARITVDSEPLLWMDDAGKLRLYHRALRPREPVSSVIARFFGEATWANTLPKPRYIKFTPEPVHSSNDRIHVTDVASFKGLEVDCAVLLFGDYASRFESELYVGISRARSIVSLLIRRDRLHLLPTKLRRVAEIHAA